MRKWVWWAMDGLLWLWTLTKLTLDYIGRGLAMRDGPEFLHSMIESLASWMPSTSPGWPGVAALVLTAVLVWDIVFRKHKQTPPAVGTLSVSQESENAALQLQLKIDKRSRFLERMPKVREAFEEFMQSTKAVHEFVSKTEKLGGDGTHQGGPWRQYATLAKEAFLPLMKIEEHIKYMTGDTISLRPEPTTDQALSQSIPHSNHFYDQWNSSPDPTRVYGHQKWTIAIALAKQKTEEKINQLLDEQRRLLSELDAIRDAHKGG